MIQAKNLTKKYRKKTAVDNLSFEVETGKVTGFLGPNGSGKSTTMRLMLGLDQGAGKTTFEDRGLFENDIPSKTVGILLEAKAFHPTRTARNHLRVLAAASGISDARVDEVLEIVGLTDVAKKRPGKFSLGMSQRLGIAAAILGKPKYLLLDEPANGLDPEGIAWLREFIKDYATKGNAVFISSHLLSELSLMADNVVVIGKGKMIADTSVKSLIDGKGHQSVYVRSSAKKLLKTALTSAKLELKSSENGVEVYGVDSDTLGEILFKAKVPVLELTNRTASLEDVFLEITSGTVEYQAKPSKKGKK